MPPIEENLRMTTHEVAKAFTLLLSEGRTQEACETFWAEDVVALEDMPGPMARLQGAAAIAEKGVWWVSNHEVHGTRVEGPWVHGSQFAIRFTFDLTPKGGARTSMDEIGLYTVAEGKITEERFFYATPNG
jgi:ketosteroid isomerase-like protein